MDRVGNAEAKPEIVSGKCLSFDCWSGCLLACFASLFSWDTKMIIWRIIRCRKGSAKLLENLAEWWPLRQPPANALREQQLCGPDLPRGFWVCLRNSLFSGPIHYGWNHQIQRINHLCCVSLISSAAGVACWCYRSMQLIRHGQQFSWKCAVFRKPAMEKVVVTGSFYDKTNAATKNFLRIQTTLSTKLNVAVIYCNELHYASRLPSEYHILMYNFHPSWVIES